MSSVFLTVVLALFGLVGILVVVLIVFAISTQRKLVRADEMTGNALSQIGIQLNSRWDAVSALVTLTRGYAAHEAETLHQVMGQRAAITAQSPAGVVEGQMKALNRATRQILAVAEAYPELKADAVFVKTMDSLNTYENQVRVSRMVYNDTVTKFNRLVREVPTSIVASLLGHKIRPYLETDGEKRDMPDVTV